MLNTLGHFFLLPNISTSYKALALYCYKLIRGMKHYKKNAKKVGKSCCPLREIKHITLNSKEVLTCYSFADL